MTCLDVVRCVTDPALVGLKRKYRVNVENEMVISLENIFLNKMKRHFACVHITFAKHNLCCVIVNDYRCIRTVPGQTSL